MRTIWGDVVDRALVLLPTLPGWSDVTVYDGPVSDKAFPKDFVTVGFVDGEDVSGSFEPTPMLGDIEEEVGSLRSELVCQTGDNDLSGMRRRAFGFVNALKAELVRDPTFGVPDVLSMSLSADMLPVQNGEGSAVRVALILSYTARGV